MHDVPYGLTGHPFDPTPDPRFWVDTASHRHAVAHLGYGLILGEGILVVTGDAGTGKTMVLQQLLGPIDRAAVNIVKVTATTDDDALLRSICAGLDVMTTGMAQAELARAAHAGLHAPTRRTLIVIDDAHALSDDGLRALHALSISGGAQVVLIGRSALRERLAPLQSRVIALHRLDPIGADEVETYLAQRLAVVGWSGTPDIGPDAAATIHAWSGGNAARINDLTHRLLLHGAARRIERFDAAEVEQLVAATAEPRARVVRPFLVDMPQTDELLLIDRIYDPGEVAVEERIAAIERRLAEQDEALRRVLGLLVDWAEAGGQVPAQLRALIA
ncbi:ExeA family protein [Sphingomonas sp. RS2018]